MKFAHYILPLFLGLFLCGGVQAQERIASVDDINLLKKDLRDNRLKIGEVRLMKIVNAYGKPSSITDNPTKLIYDYGDLRLSFNKIKYLKSWKFDYSKKPVYSDAVDDLRYDLSAGQIAGDFITYANILNTYGDPTEAHEKYGDGEQSIYYYGEIKLVFENNILLQSWKGRALSDDQVGSSQGVLGSSSK